VNLVRIDNLKKCISSETSYDYKPSPIWTVEFKVWVHDNRNLIEDIITYYDPIRNHTLYILKFLNEEDATIFSLQFS
jgi:hypothetical protein